MTESHTTAALGRAFRRPQGYTAAGLYLAVAALLFFWDALFNWPAGKIMAGGDITTMFVPWLSFIFDSLRQHGQLPLWNPYLFSGVPFAANPQPMLFYPFTYLGLFLPLARAMALTLAIHAWLGGMGAYGWLRSLGATHGGALLAGLAFAFTGAFSLRVGVGHYGIALQLAWWPLSFWALHNAFARGSWRRAVLSGIPLALGLLSGHSATCLLLYVALGLYTAFVAGLVYWQNKQWRAAGRVLGLGAAAVGTSLALAAVQYLPLFTFSQLSVRTASPSLDFSSRFSMPFGHLIALLVPNFFGEVIRTGYWSVEGYAEMSYYVGVLVFFLAVCGLRLVLSSPESRPAQTSEVLETSEVLSLPSSFETVPSSTDKHRLLFFLALALGAVLLQLGPDGVLFVLFYRFVPGFALTRAPGRAGLIYLFAMITVAGLSWSQLERASQARLQSLLGLFDRRFVGLVSALGVGAMVVAFMFYAAARPDGPAWTWHMADQLARFLVLFWGVMALLAAWRGGRLSRPALNGLALLLVILDLWSYGLRGIRPVSDDLAPTWSNVASFMQDKLDYRVTSGEYQLFEHNGALGWRVRSPLGYDPLALARYQALLDSAPDYSDRVYDLLNVRYIVSPHGIHSDWPGLHLSFDGYGLKVYRRSSALPRAWIVHDAIVEPDDQKALGMLHAEQFGISRTVTLLAAPPCEIEPAQSAEETAQVVGESPNHLELSTHLASAGLLVLSEVYYPGWQASVDGQPAQVLRADTTLRAVCLPAGSHSVRLDFWPRDLLAGALVSALSLCLVLGLVLVRHKP
ncbi:MAG: YfhO family protein [Thermoflexales bacterium]|nr:YfhO family protein [Thermoflexales bacterium]